MRFVQNPMEPTGQFNYTEGVTNVHPVYTTYVSVQHVNTYTFTVPQGEMWELAWVHLNYNSGPTVGNRQLEMDVVDTSGNHIFSLSAGATQPANKSYDYHFVQGVYRETSFVANEIQTPFGSMMHLMPGYQLVVYDSANISAAGDGMNIGLQTMRYKGAS